MSGAFMRLPDTALFAVLLLCVSCAQTKPSAQPETWRKDEFDLTQLDADGLRGPFRLPRFEIRRSMLGVRCSHQTPDSGSRRPRGL